MLCWHCGCTICGEKRLKGLNTPRNLSAVASASTMAALRTCIECRACTHHSCIHAAKTSSRASNGGQEGEQVCVANDDDADDVGVVCSTRCLFTATPQRNVNYDAALSRRIELQFEAAWALHQQQVKQETDRPAPTDEVKQEREEEGEKKDESKEADSHPTPHESPILAPMPSNVSEVSATCLPIVHSSQPSSVEYARLRHHAWLSYFALAQHLLLAPRCSHWTDTDVSNLTHLLTPYGQAEALCMLRAPVGLFVCVPSKAVVTQELRRAAARDAARIALWKETESKLLERAGVAAAGGLPLGHQAAECWTAQAWMAAVTPFMGATTRKRTRKNTPS